MSETRICSKLRRRAFNRRLPGVGRRLALQTGRSPDRNLRPLRRSGSNTRKTPSRTIPTHSATTAFVNTTSAARTATALFTVTAPIGTMTTIPTVRLAGMSTTMSFTNTATRPTSCSMARACGISVWSSKSMTAAVVNSNAQKLLDIANKDAENLYIKTDGSLDEGLELVPIQ